ncbi:MAG: UDP-2,3-diacylglucosamine diphosphatase [Ignavibacteria bacterium]|nr:UDP-2,3-diacylglucosamine diphosphatase [Ignavibacteria bacterium]
MNQYQEEFQVESGQRKVETIIVSDIHLGSEVARPKAVRKVLESHDFNRLILLGDIFDDLNFNRLKKDHWNLLSYIRKLSNPDRNKEVVWVEGNHDEGLSEIMSLMMGVKVYDEYVWESNGKTFLAIHGHQFDKFLTENVLISNVSSYVYDKVQKWDSETQSISRFIKRRSKSWLRLSNKVATEAIEYARGKGADAVICGHTHQSISVSNEGVAYFNTGCWTDIPSNYIVIDSDGNVEIREESPALAAQRNAS